MVLLVTMPENKLSAELQTMKENLEKTNYPAPLRDYLLSLAARLESEVNTLDSFVPFTVELHVY